MIDLAASSVHEMVLEFLRQDIQSPDWIPYYQKSRHWTRRGALLEHPDLQNDDDNAARGELLGAGRGYGQNAALFAGFPPDVTWRRFEMGNAEVQELKYIAEKTWIKASNGSRLVGDGAKYLHRHPKLLGKTDAIARRYRAGESLGMLIAVRADAESAPVLLEGHHRATAMVRARKPESIEILMGTSARVSGWHWFEERPLRISPLPFGKIE